MSARPRKPADSKRSYTRLLRPDERSDSAEPGDAPARLARDSAAEFQAQARVDPATDLGDLPARRVCIA